MRIQNKPNLPKIGVIGKVKVGETRTKNGKPYPVALDYFRFTSDQESRVSRMAELLGEKPTRIPLTFPTGENDVVCDHRYELRDGSGQLVVYGDGCQFYESKPEGFLKLPEMDVEGGGAYMDAQAKKTGFTWSERLFLRFLILGCKELGLWEFSSMGKETSIGQIVAAFDTVKEMAGRVTGVPFWLTVQKHKSNRANANRVYPVVNLVCDLSPEMIEAVAGAGDSVKGLITPEKLQLAAPQKVEPGPEVEEVQAEEITLLDQVKASLSGLNSVQIKKFYEADKPLYNSDAKVKKYIWEQYQKAQENES